MPAPLLLDNQNLEFLLLRRYAAQEANPIKRGYAWLESGKMRRWERANFVRSSLVMVCSGHDRKLAEGLADGRPVAVIPNVVDVGEYRPAAAEGSTLLYTGGMDWHPNRDAVEFFASSILPHLRRLGSDARLVVAGRSPAEAFRRRFAAIPEIQFTGAVPDMRVELARAAISVVPLRVGSGTRLKILEAAAMGKAVVSTTMGAEGLDFENGREILLADDPEEFARAVTGLLQDPERRRRVGLAARRKVEAQYSIEALCLALRNALATQGSGTAGAVDIRAGR
jgi:glycosyltransferase involved in cell wall biosynthesis